MSECIWVPTKPECSTRPFYRGETCINWDTCMAGKKKQQKNTWLCWHSPNELPQMLSNKPNPTEQVKPDKMTPRDQVFSTQLNTWHEYWVAYLEESELQLTLCHSLLMQRGWVNKCWSLMVGWVLWHINLCRLFNAKSIFIQTIQFSMSTQFNCKKTFLFQAFQFSQIVLFQTIQFSISTQFSSI